jgi:peroxiredoxin
MKLATGSPAPDFSLYDTTRNKITLSLLRGNKVLLLFFPQAFSRVCTKELCYIRDSGMSVAPAGTTVLGISVDSVFTLARYRETENYNFTLLSDFNKEVSGLYGCLYDNWILDMKGVSKRAAFLIDKSGLLRYQEILENAGEEPNYEAIRKAAEELD